MEEDEEFVDIYALLQVDPSCERSIIEKAYRHFAQLYHPDHTETAERQQTLIRKIFPVLHG